jgi:hypothetical protein
VSECGGECKVGEVKVNGSVTRNTRKVHWTDQEAKQKRVSEHLKYGLP